MLLQSVFLRNFRNYKECHVEIDKSKTVFLIGKNGQGKTNFLEALYYLSYGNSFRTKKEEEVIFLGESDYKISGVFDKNSVNHNIEISYINNKKKLVYNDSTIKNRKDIFHVFPSLIFKHSDIFFVSGSSEYQRQYLDQILVLNHEDYAQAFQQYKRITNQKKAALKNEQYDIISVYNEQLAACGFILVQHRKKIIKYINENLPKAFAIILGENIEITMEYSPSWSTPNEQDTETSKKAIFSYLQSQREQEKRYKTCVSGPHRDSIKIMYKNYEFKKYASTGQIRIISLILRSIQASYYSETNKSAMIYLFDDVLLELDTEKQKKIISYLPQPQQSFYTFLPEENLPHFLDSEKKLFFRVEKGALIKE